MNINAMHLHCQLYCRLVVLYIHAMSGQDHIPVCSAACAHWAVSWALKFLEKVTHIFAAIVQPLDIGVNDLHVWSTHALRDTHAW